MTETDVAATLAALGAAARAASARMAASPRAKRDAALRALAARLREAGAELEAANAQDLRAASDNGLAGPLLDRLRLDAHALATVVEGCLQLAEMPDPIGEITGVTQRPSGIRVGRMRVPLGVFGMIYESRPNVTIEAASLAIKSGNACILRGGSEAILSPPPVIATPTSGWIGLSESRPACASVGASAATASVARAMICFIAISVDVRLKGGAESSPAPYPPGYKRRLPSRVANLN